MPVWRPGLRQLHGSQQQAQPWRRPSILTKCVASRGPVPCAAAGSHSVQWRDRLRRAGGGAGSQQGQARHPQREHRFHGARRCGRPRPHPGHPAHRRLRQRPLLHPLRWRAGRCDDALHGNGALAVLCQAIGSVSVSGHKFIGSPVPCGIIITRRKYVAALSSDVEYINSSDSTIMGSRNGHAPIYMWYTLAKKGLQGIRRDVEECMRNARALQGMLERAGVEAMRNELSTTVVFERPLEEALVRKWQLACQGSFAHVVVMPNVGINKLEIFVKELVLSRERMAIASAKRGAAAA
jgi:hypothetical protein